MQKIGELFLSNEDSMGGPVLLKSFKGVKIGKICGGGHRAFIIEEGDTERGVIHTLHAPEYDDYDYTASEQQPLVQSQHLLHGREQEPSEQGQEGEEEIEAAGLAEHLPRREDLLEEQQGEEEQEQEEQEEQDLEEGEEEEWEKQNLSNQVQNYNGTMSDVNNVQSIFDNKGSILKIVSSGQNMLEMLNSDGELFTSGSGEYGVMGRGSSVGSVTPQKLKTLKNVQIVDMEAGHHHSLALSSSRDVYSWGRGFEGQLGQGPNQCASFPRLIGRLNGLRFKTTAREEMSTELYHGKNVEMSEMIPKVIPSNLIRSICCGAFHSLAVTEDGLLFGWGANDCSQLGFESRRPVFTPRVMPVGEAVRGVAAGYSHTLVLTKEGALFTAGLNHKYQLGLGDSDKRAGLNLVKEDFYNQELPTLVDVSSGDYNCFALSEHGQIFSWGSGILGVKDTPSIERPKEIEGEFEDRNFTKIFASTGNVIFFSPLKITSMKPCSGPSSGGTTFTILGTGLCDMEGRQKIRFSYGPSSTPSKYTMEVPLVFDENTSSFSCKTPPFDSESVWDEVSWPMEASIHVALDGDTWDLCPETFFIYGSDVRVTGLKPKYGSKDGGIEMEIETSANEETLARFVNINIGFQAFSAIHLDKAREESVDRSLFTENRHQADVNPEDLSLDSPELDKDDWVYFNARIKDGKITCKVPSIFELKNDVLFYNVDISFNEKQLLGSPSTFQYYDIVISDVRPDNTVYEGGTRINIQGSGCFDTITKKVKLENSYGERLIDAKWDKVDGHYFFFTPPISWLAGDQEAEAQADKEAIASEPVKIWLTLSDGVQWIDVGEYYYLDPAVARVVPGPVREAKGESEEEFKEKWAQPEPIVDVFEGLNEKEIEKKKVELEKKMKEEELEIENVPRAPGSLLFLEGVFDPNQAIHARFSFGDQGTDQPCVFKNEGRVGVEVPTISGPEQGLVDILVTVSFNGGEQFGKNGQNIKYYCFDAETTPAERTKLFEEEVKKAKKIKK